MSSSPLHLAAIGSVFALGLGVGLACTTTTKNTAHCYYNAGNATCRERDSMLPFCSLGCDGSPNGDGCVADEPDAPCYSPCGGEMAIADDATCLDIAGTDTTAPTSASDPSTTDPTPTTDDPTPGTTDPDSTETGGMPCQSSLDCGSGSTPICIAQVCVACDETPLADEACAEKDPATPACGASGDCVECTASNAAGCPESAPICGDEQCRGCVAHDECGSGVCAIASGECFPDACRFEVPGDAATLQAAVDTLASGASCIFVLTDDRIGAGIGNTLIVDEGKDVAIVGENGERFQITGGAGPTLAISQSANVYVVGLRVSANDDSFGARVIGAGARLYVDDSEIVDNDGGGISVESGAFLQVRNSIVGGAPDLSAVDVTGTSEAMLVYATLVGATGDASALSCPPTATVDVRNSLLVGRGPAALDIPCAATMTYSATEAAFAGMGNMVLGELNTTTQGQWFVDYPSADFHLDAPPGVLLTTARWLDLDPPVDLDGDPRPDRDGAMDVAGADVP